jgi:DNA-binding NarL/FixJ family response regulator
MTENKKVSLENRDAKGKILTMLLELPEEKKKELIEKYKSEGPINEITVNNHRIIVGTWHNRAVKALIRGATADEINRMINVIFVAVNAPKENLDVSEAIEKERMDDIIVKYIRPDLIEQRKMRDRQAQLQQAAKMRTVLEMHKHGFNNQRIAEILEIPESTVRFFVKNKSIEAK